MNGNCPLPKMPFEIKVDGQTATGNGEPLTFYTQDVAEQVYWRTCEEHPEEVVELYKNGRVEMAWVPDSKVVWVPLKK